MKRRWVQFGLAWLLSLAIALPAAATDAKIWSMLRSGGHVVLMRHGMVDNLSKSTSPDADFEGCEGQYNLTVDGRAQAKAVGEKFRRQRVPIGEVLASPLCRARDTARIAFGTYRALPELEPLPETPGDEHSRRVEAMARLISSHAGKGNLVIVTHQPNIEALTLELVAPATLVVLKPGRGGRFDVVGTVQPPPVVSH